MRPRPYPLAALRKIRSQAQDAAVVVHKASLKALAAARETHAVAEQSAARVAEQRVAHSRTAAASGAELAVAGIWAAKLQHDHVTARELAKRMATEVKRLARAERLAQDALRQAYIESQLVERHYANFAEEERRRIQKYEDDEMDDLIPHLMKREPGWF
jgi:hypothetical protein